MPLQLDDLLHSLARFMVARAASFSPSVSIDYGSASAELFRWEVQEKDTSAVLYSVISIIGGPPAQKQARPTISIQCKTTGKSNKAAVIRAQTLFDTLLDDDGTPIRLRTIDGYRASDNAADGHWILANITWTHRPGLTGRDERGRIEILFTFDLDAYEKD